LKKISPFSQFRTALEEGSTSCEALVNHCLDTIKEHADLNAYLSIYEEEIKKQALAIDKKVQQAKGGKLAGMLIGLKDILCYKDHPLQAASKILDGFVSQFTATAVQKLIDQDALIIGRLNCDEFAMGSSNENSSFGPVKNGIDPSRVPGGSSGGSAVAVQTGTCHVALGSDTGGSVRQPAAFCGIIGLKPTYARISRYGLIAYASSFDTIGIFSKNIADCATTLQVMAGNDPHDNTSSSLPVPDYTKSLPLPKKLKIAYLDEAINHEGLQPAIKANTLQVMDRLRAQGHQVDCVHFSLLHYTLPAYYILSTAEASANLARFDGIRYGYRSKQAANLEELYVKTRTEGFGEEVQRRILLGTFILNSQYYESYFVKAQKVRRLIKEAMEQILQEYDFILLPTTPSTAFKLASGPRDPITTYLEDLFTVPANLSGLPAISIPNGADEKGLPIGLQIISSAFQEHSMLSFSQYMIEEGIVEKIEWPG